jgi:hypothetical protein
MSDEHIHRRTISIRLSEKLNIDLRRAADDEGNPPSAVARRLIAAGLARERVEPRTAPIAPDDAA